MTPASVTPFTTADREASRAERRQRARAASVARAGREALRAAPTATITPRGRELARLLSPYLATGAASPDQISRVCSLIARLATRHRRICEIECSVELDARQTERIDAESERIQARVRALVASLPPSHNGPLEAVFQGDPRGYTVRVKVPNLPQGGNTWGLGGEFGI